MERLPMEVMVCLFLLILCPTLQRTMGLSADFVVLLAFKEQLDGDGKARLSSWDSSSENPCGWEGVTCAENSTTVLRGLDLRWCSLQGTLPASFGSLKGLELLDLSDNHLYGAIPPEIADARGLRRLALSRNLLNGSIPANISQLRSLQELSLEGNSLSGVIPSLQGLTNLTLLHLSRNGLTGQIPYVGGLTKLQELYLDENGLTGSIPELKGLTSLRGLLLNDNHLTGVVPILEGLTMLEQLHLHRNNLSGRAPLLVGLDRLQEVDMSGNQLEGRLPSHAIAGMAQLATLNLSANYLSGEIPGDIWRNCSNTLVNLDLSRNQFSGSIPGELLSRDMTKLQFLSLAYNRLNRTIPVGCLDCVNPALKSIDFSSNWLEGSVPPLLLYSGMESLTYLNLSSNSLNGSINLSPGWPNGLETLDLSNNALDGSLPGDIGSTAWARSLQRLWLHNNHFGGDIDQIWSGGSQVSSLRELYLQGNQFYGSLGALTLGNWKYLEVLDLSHNLLSLNISEGPSVLDSLPNLSELRLGGNNGTGTLPSTLGSMLQLEVLDLSHSNLQGKVSAQVFTSNSLPSLTFLDLSDNLLTGAVPAGLLQMAHLTYMDLSGNNFSGPLPAMNPNLSQARFFSPGNEGLCGYPMPNCPLSASASVSARSGIASGQLLITICACVIISLGSCLLLGWRWRVYSRKHRQDADLIAALQDRRASSASLMSLRELRRATSNFSNSCQIGVGGFGTVYAGKLGDGTSVAIKRSKRGGTEKDKHQFLNEVTILSQVNHRNLVRLLGCCLENKVALLVFEFVPNGTLKEHLQGAKGHHPLSWRQRLHIAVQTADALTYLHSAANPPIFHRDVKSANVLLDENLNAKVADFGISKLAPTLEATHVSTVIQGTIGYIDPEYYTTFQLNGKSDVYSFGVVLLELISGQAPVDFQRGVEDASLVNWAVPLICAGDMKAILDPALSETFVSPSGQESIACLGKLAARCLKPKSKDRPSMKAVVRGLQDIWLQSEGAPHLISTDLSGSQDHPDSSEVPCYSTSITCSNNSSSFETSSSMGATDDLVIEIR